MAYQFDADASGIDHLDEWHKRKYKNLRENLNIVQTEVNALKEELENEKGLCKNNCLENEWRKLCELERAMFDEMTKLNPSLLIDEEQVMSKHKLEGIFHSLNSFFVYGI